MKNLYRLISVIVMCLALLPNVCSQRYMENLNHGMLALKTDDGILVSWRVLESEWYDVTYNIYRNGVKINDSAIDGASNILDESGTTSSTYTLSLVENGIESETGESCSVWEQAYLDIPVRTIEVEGDTTLYALNDASVGDLDGDGEYEVVVKRLVADNDTSLTYYHYLEAYELDGTFMWAVNMGPNIYDGTEFNFLVYDLDMDGKAEIALRTSDGFIDGEGNDIGDYDNDGITNYRYSVSTWLVTGGYRCEGPDYISILDGETGAQLAITDYIDRGSADDWGKSGDGGHRATKCMFTVAYLDGKKPSFIVGRGIYARTAFAAWTFENGTLTQNWTFDSNDAGNSAYAGQGYHNLTLGDVDLDGRDELVYGSMVMDDDGTGLYSTELGHGDAQHLADINPYRKGLEYFGCLEENEGGSYRDASTGEVLFYKNIGRDMGRAGCSDITPDYPGMEMWGPTGFPFLSSDGTEITDLDAPSSMNFFIWWDGDVTRELLDHEWNSTYGIGTIVKYDNGENNQLLYAEGTLSDNWTKGNPCLSADILGDWREEVIWRTEDNTALRLYATPYTTDKKIYTLMDDPQYRAAIGWQANSYNQPPHPSFFIGTDMDSIPPAPVLFDGLKVYSSGNWDLESTSAFYDDDELVKFSDGDKVLFDVSAESADIELSAEVSPAEVRVISPVDFTFSGEGDIAGSGRLIKAGEGNLTIKNTNSYTGLTRVWAGQLTVDGELSSSEVLVKRFAALAGTGSLNNSVTIEPYAYLIAGDGEGKVGSITISNGLTIAENAFVNMDLSSDTIANDSINDIINVIGDLTLEGDITLTINKLDEALSPGTYTLMTFSGDFIGDIDDITIKGISETPKSLEISDGKMLLIVPETREAATVVWSGVVDENWDLYETQNWLNDGVVDYFIGNDSVIFNSEAMQTTVNMVDEYPVGGVLFDADVDYTLEGDGSISGESGLTKRGTGTLTISNSNGFTGPVVIEEGIVSVSTMSNGGYSSPLGAASVDSSNFVINGGELELTNDDAIYTDHNILIGENNAVMTVVDEDGQVTLSGMLSGEGWLIKEGDGQIELSSASTHVGTIINEGTIELIDDAANIAGLGDTLVLNSGTLAMNDNAYSYTDNCAWNIVVPEDKEGTLKMDSRCSLTGTLTGNGTLNLYSPFVRCDLKGDWSAFTGTINVTSDSGGGDFRIYNSYGYENASVNIDGVLYTYNQTGSATSFGSLEGIEEATLASGTWNVGYNNNDATFAGYITGESVISKYGAGTWTLTNDNDYSGETNVMEGVLDIENLEVSATGTSTVTVDSSAYVVGLGIIDGDVVIEENATCALTAGSIINGQATVNGLLAGEVEFADSLIIGSTAIITPGGDSIGAITSDLDVELVSGSTLIIQYDKSTDSSDQLICAETVTIGGALKMKRFNGCKFSAGDSIQIISASDIEGEFESIKPSSPGKGLVWNVSELYTNGIITVGIDTNSENGSHQGHGKLYPNPCKGKFYFNMDDVTDVKKIEVKSIDGKVISHMKNFESFPLEFNLNNVPNGIYFICVYKGTKCTSYKVIKKE